MSTWAPHGTQALTAPWAPCAVQKPSGGCRPCPPALSLRHLCSPMSSGCRPRPQPHMSAGTSRQGGALRPAEGPAIPCPLTCRGSRVDHSVCKACRNGSGSWPGGTRQGLCRVHGSPPHQCPGAPHRRHPVPMDSGPSSPLPLPWDPAWPSCSAHWDGLLPTAWGSPGLMFQWWWAAGLRLATLETGIGPQSQAHSTDHQGMPGGPPRPHPSVPRHSHAHPLPTKSGLQLLLGH